MNASESEQQPRKLKDRWWKQAADEKLDNGSETPHEGTPCPFCLIGDLHYNGLFQLICENCGYVAEAAVFT